jgi:hypothetical protein
MRSSRAEIDISMVAATIGMSREHLSRWYSHLFSIGARCMPSSFVPELGEGIHHRVGKLPEVLSGVAEGACHGTIR